MCVCVCVSGGGWGWVSMRKCNTYKDLEAWRNQQLSGRLRALYGFYLAMVCAQSVNYFIGADMSPFLLNRRDIVLLIHSHPSPLVNRMWPDRKKSNYFFNMSPAWTELICSVNTLICLLSPPHHLAHLMEWILEGTGEESQKKKAVTNSKSM